VIQDGCRTVNVPVEFRCQVNIMCTIYVKYVQFHKNSWQNLLISIIYLRKTFGIVKVFSNLICIIYYTYEFKGPNQELTRQYYKWFTHFTQVPTSVTGKVLLTDEAWCHFSEYFNRLNSRIWSAEN
jgi:hypothetical protein